MPVSSSLTASDIVVRTAGLVEAEVDGEIVALDIDKGTCYGLNKVGSRIWNLIAEPTRIGDLCARLTSEFRVDEATCERQVLDLLEEMRAEGMIGLREQAAAPNA